MAVKKPYTVRLDEEKVIKPLKKLAEKENRTVANIIETAIIEYLLPKKQK